jgi:SSS family solute:Na+ symporter
MGLAFMFTIIVMVAMSLAGPKINPKAFQLGEGMFKVKPTHLTMIVVILLILSALYIKFW